MTGLEQALTDYLTMRRALGYKLERDGKLLTQFVTYLETHGAQTITTEQALAWAQLPTGGSPGWFGARLSVVRGFATYLQSIDPATQVPPSDLLTARSGRATPYLYSDEQIAALISAAGTLGDPLRIATYQSLVGLLAATGLRVGEALRLDRRDIDFANDLLVVHNTKFGKTREVPLHATTMHALHAYLHRPDRRNRRAHSPAVFISTVGTRVLVGNVQNTFRQLVRRAALTPRSANCRPRLHDLRHTFAIRTVMDSYRTNNNVEHRLSLLSTYLGHVNPNNTYWYLSAAPELMALAGQRLDRHLEGRS